MGDGYGGGFEGGGGGFIGRRCVFWGCETIQSFGAIYRGGVGDF